MADTNKETKSIKSKKSKKEQEADKVLTAQDYYDQDPLFRYLEKYVGTYRVLSHYNEEEGDFPRTEDGEIEPSYDELYLKCSRGEVRSSYKKVDGKGVILCWYTESGQQGRNTYKQLHADNPKMWMEVEDDGTYDYWLFFEEKDLAKVMKAVGAQKSGAKIKPFSDKNLPAPLYAIPEADLAEYNKIVEDLDRTQKIFFAKECNTNFDANMTKKFSTKRKPYDPAAERKSLRMKPKEFIHYKGMWSEYIEYVKEKHAEKFN